MKNAAKRSYSKCLKQKKVAPKGCPFGLTTGSFKIDKSTIKWNRGPDPFRKAKVKSGQHPGHRPDRGQRRDERRLHVERTGGHLLGQRQARGERVRVLGEAERKETWAASNRSAVAWRRSTWPDDRFRDRAGHRLLRFRPRHPGAGRPVPARQRSVARGTTEIPADKPMTGAFIELRDQAEAAVRDIITTLEPDEPGTEAGQDRRPVRQLHGQPTRSRRPAPAPLAPLLAAIDAVASPTSSSGCSAVHPHRRSTGWSASTPSPIPATRPLRDVRRSGRARAARRGVLPARHAMPRSATQYREHIAASFELAGVADPADQARQVLDLETEIAATHWDKVQLPRPAADVQPDDRWTSSSPAAPTCTGGSSWPAPTSTRRR